MKQPSSCAKPLVIAIGLGLGMPPAAAQTYGPPSVDGLIWSLDSFEGSRGQDVATFSYAIPETDAYRLIARCDSDRAGPAIEVFLSVEFGTRENGEPVDIVFGADDYMATYSGNVRIMSSEFAGVAVPVSITDAFWDVMQAGGPSMTYHLSREAGSDFRYVPVRGASEGVRAFLSECRRMFTGFDAAADPQFSAPVDYVCEDGSRFSMRLDTSRSYTVAQISLGGRTSSLMSAESGSGSRYVGDGIELLTKGDEAYVALGGGGRTCLTR